MERDAPPDDPAPRAQGTGRALVVLIGVNVAIYVAWQIAAGQPALYEFMRANFLVSLPLIAEHRYWTLLTSAFSHMSPDHLLFNMIGLYVFGRDVQHVLGPGRFVQVYLVGGLIASVGHLVYTWIGGDATPALGASGAVMALAVLFGALYPRRTLLVNFFIPIPAALAVALYIIIDVVGAMSGGTAIGHAAHLGGAAYGLVYYLLYVRPRLVRRRQ